MDAKSRLTAEFLQRLAGDQAKALAGHDVEPRPTASSSSVIGMARKPANSGHAAKQMAKTTMDASLPLDASVLSIVAGLEGHDLDGLRRRWRAHLGGEPPAHLCAGSW